VFFPPGQQSAYFGCNFSNITPMQNGSNQGFSGNSGGILSQNTGIFPDLNKSAQTSFPQQNVGIFSAQNTGPFQNKNLFQQGGIFNPQSNNFFNQQNIFNDQGQPSSFRQS